jgi:hypothetical protein
MREARFVFLFKENSMKAKILIAVLLVLLVVLVVPQPFLFAQEETVPVVEVANGNILFEGQIYDVSEMTGPVVKANYVQPGSLCNSVRCSYETIIEFKTQDGGNYVLYPAWKWVGLSQLNNGTDWGWHTRANFKDYSLVVGWEDYSMPQIQEDVVVWGDVSHEFGGDVWHLEVSPDGLYLVALITPNNSTTYDDYYLAGVSNHLGDDYLVYVLSQDGQVMYAGNLGQPYGVWMEPDGDYLLTFDSWHEMTEPIESPDGSFVAYGSKSEYHNYANLPFVIYSVDGQLLQIIRYAGETFTAEGYDWAFLGGWYNLPPEDGIYAATFSNGKWTGCREI